jgi:hypothetical protein
MSLLYGAVYSAGFRQLAVILLKVFYFLWSYNKTIFASPAIVGSILVRYSKVSVSGAKCHHLFYNFKS